MASEKSDTDSPTTSARDRGASDVQNALFIALTAHTTSQYATTDMSPTLAEHMSRQYINKSRVEVDAEALDLAEKSTTAETLEAERNFFMRGALLAWSKDQTGQPSPELSPTEAEWLRKEGSNKITENFRIPWPMWLTAVLCGMSAVVQGMDQSAVNGAQGGYEIAFGVHNQWIEGLINGAPYLCCAFIGCWTGPFLNKLFGRKGTIGVSCLFAVASGLWQMCVSSTWELFAARFLMGLAIGAKSSTTPAYAAECAPAKIRGAIGTQWQMWTAFGIMLGLAVDVAFMSVHTSTWGQNSGWRIMLGSTAVPPVVVMILLFFVPESPRWYIINGKYRQAYKSLCKLRNCRLQAARDLYDIDATFRCEGVWRAQHDVKSWKTYLKLFTNKRNRRGAISSGFVMFMQQMCGVNVIAYFSTQIFKDAGFSVEKALVCSLGAGIINWIGAIPGTLTIDSKGRRRLLLWTFPMMSASLLFAGSGFYITDAQARLSVVATGIYLFMVVYSPGMGPVPFTYSAEAYPLEVRDVGMSFATAVCWGFNFLLALTFPSLSKAFGTGGAFFFYAAWNIVGFVYTYFFLQETKKLPLEMVDVRFRVSLRQFGRLNYYSLPWNRNRLQLPQELEVIRDTMTREYESPGGVVEKETEKGDARQYFSFTRRRKPSSMSAKGPSANGRRLNSDATGSTGVRTYSKSGVVTEQRALSSATDPRLASVLETRGLQSQRSMDDGNCAVDPLDLRPLDLRSLNLRIPPGL